MEQAAVNSSDNIAFTTQEIQAAVFKIKTFSILEAVC